MFEAKNISYSVGAKKILDEVSIELKPGETVALLGANGAGKSTLLKALCGDINLESGEVILEKRKLQDWNYHQLARKRAILLQHSNLNFPFTVEEVALLGRNPHIRGTESKKDLEIVRNALKLVEAEHLTHQSFPTLSGGEQQRVHLARVLAQIWEKPQDSERYLLLDEPTSSLDLAHQHLTLQTARKFADKGTAVLMVLHDLNLAAQYADKIMILQKGKKVTFGTPNNVLTKEIIQEVFGIEVYITKHETKPDLPLIIPTGIYTKTEKVFKAAI